MRVYIPTIKKTDCSVGCVYPNVFCFGMRLDTKPHEDLIKAKNYYVEFDEYHQKLYNATTEISYNAELIHQQHHYTGALKQFLNEKKIATVYRGVVLNIEDGGIFLNMVKNKKRK